MQKENTGNLGAPINEAVYLLYELDPNGLADARQHFPQLESELVLGRMGGEREESENLETDRAEFMRLALNAAKKEADKLLLSIKGRMRASRKLRLGAQIAAFVCSSGVLAAIALGPRPITVITALLSLLASVGTMVSEYKEQLLKKGGGDIYDAYEGASQAAYKAGLMSENIRLLLKHKANASELNDLIKAANLLCEELNDWVHKIAGSN